MNIFDEKFKYNKLRYILQCLLAVSFVSLALILLDAVSNAAIIASLAASSLIAFTMPEIKASAPRFLIGGYVVAIVAGSLSYYLSTLAVSRELFMNHEFMHEIFGSLAAGLAIFLMVITNTEHPPAVSLALGLVFNECNLWTITISLGGITLMSFIKWALKPYLKNLL